MEQCRSMVLPVFIIDSEFEGELCGSDTIIDLHLQKHRGCCCVSTVCHCRHLAARRCNMEKARLTVSQLYIIIKHFPLTVSGLYRFLPCVAQM